MTMHQHLEFPRLGMTVTIAPAPVNASDIDAARRTHGEMLALLDELTLAASAGQPTLHAVLRSIQGMARSVGARLDRIGGGRDTR